MIEILIFIALAIAGVALYFLPAYIAFVRNHKNKVAILILNIFLGWSFIGWIVALIWAFTNS